MAIAVAAAQPVAIEAVMDIAWHTFPSLDHVGDVVVYRQLLNQELTI